MNLIARLLFKTSPRAAKAAPDGTAFLEFDSAAGADGNLLLTVGANASRPFGGNARSGTPVSGVQAVKTITSNNTQVTTGDTVTIGSKVYTFRTFRATNLLTSDATLPADGSTIIIGTKTYTFQTTLTNVDGNVKIAASVTLTLDNLFHAINASGGVVGTDYATATTASTLVTATKPSATTVLLTAILAGTAQNAHAVTCSTVIDSHIDAAAVTLGGVGATSISTGGLVEGEIHIGADADASLLNLIRAINHSGTYGTDHRVYAAHPVFSAAVAVTAHAFAVTGLEAGAAQSALTFSETAATLSWANTTTGGRQQGGPAV